MQHECDEIMDLLFEQYHKVGEKDDNMHEE